MHQHVHFHEELKWKEPVKFQKAMASLGKVESKVAVHYYEQQGPWYQGINCFLIDICPIRKVLLTALKRVIGKRKYLASFPCPLLL